MTSQASTRHARVDVADVLRGLAVLGIVLLHSIEHFNFYSFPDTATQPQWLNFTDRAIWDGLFFLLGGKAYAVFALLFGFSFFIQDDNQRMRGNDFRRRFCWRLFLLFVIGNINALFFTGEVLVMYSLVGYVLVLVCRWSTRTLLWVAAVLMLQPAALVYIFMALADPTFVAPEIPTSSFWAATFEMQLHGDFWGTLLVNAHEGQLASLAWAWDNGRIFQTASLFIIGMLIGRQGWLLEKNLHRWGYVFAWSIAAFFPLYGLLGMIPDFVSNPTIVTQLKLLLKSLSSCAFMFMLVSGVLWLYYRTAMRTVLRRIIPYGRMSMTNYVGQSIIGSLLFYNWGFGLHAWLGITASVFVGACIFLAQYAFCLWWTRRHSHGPMEYAWKRLTWL